MNEKEKVGTVWPLKICLFFLLAVFIISIFMRMESITGDALSPYKTQRPWNQEVITHTTSILLGYEQRIAAGIPQSFMPSGPMARDEISQKKHIDGTEDVAWNPYDPESSFLKDRFNESVYISFPPGGFLALYMITAPIPGHIDPISVRISGVFLQGLTVFLMVMIVWHGSGASPIARGAGSAMAGLSYIIGTEAWHSSVASVWTHHVAQPVFMTFILVFIIAGGSWRLPLLFAMAFLSGFMEWSGHILSAGIGVGALIMAIMALDRNRWAKATKDTIAIAAGASLSLAITIIHIIWSVGIDHWIAKISGRISLRSGGEFGISETLSAISMSAGPWIAAALFLAFLVFDRKKMIFSKKDSGETINNKQRVYVAIGALLVASMETLVLQNHAQIYSFAALKILSLAGLVCGFCLAALIDIRGKSGITLITGAMILSIFGSIITTNKIYGGKGSPDAGAEKRMAEKIMDNTPKGSLPILVPMENNGINVWLGEKVIHAENSKHAIEKARKRGAGLVTIITLGGERPWKQARHTSIESIETLEIQIEERKN